MRQVTVHAAVDAQARLEGAVTTGRPTPVRPFRRLRLSLELPPTTENASLLALQFRDNVEVARDAFDLHPGHNDLVIQTSADARGIALGLDGHHDPDRPAPTATLDDLGERPTPDGMAFIIGAMKSGTSTLYGSLRHHPAIDANTRKEPAFFSSNAVYRGHYAYFSQFRFDPGQHRWSMEGSTDYTKHPQCPGVPERIAALPCDARFIYLMRDPVERIESHLAHNVAKGRLALDELEGAFESCIEVSRYSAQLDRYAEVFDDLRDRLLLIDFHDMVDDLPRTLRRVEAFLGIDPHDYPPRPPSNLRTSAHGADQVALTTDQTAYLWERLRDEESTLAASYGFRPRVPWGAHGSS